MKQEDLIVIDLRDVNEKKQRIMSFNPEHGQTALVQLEGGEYYTCKFFKKSNKVRLNPSLPMSLKDVKGEKRIMLWITSSIERWQNIGEDGFYEEIYDEDSDINEYRKINIYEKNTKTVILLPIIHECSIEFEERQ